MLAETGLRLVRALDAGEDWLLVAAVAAAGVPVEESAG